MVVTVNPTPQVVPGTFAQTICNKTNTNITLNSPSTFTSGIITFNYTVVATGGVTGFTTPVNGLPNGAVISDLLSNPANSPQTVTYTIVPVSPTGCANGPSQVVVVTVNPTPQVVPGTLAQTICNKTKTNIILNSPSTFTSGNITFNYTVVATGGVTGFTTPVNGLHNGTVISDLLSNPLNSPQTVTYTIVPVSPTGCANGPSQVVVVTVQPTPKLNITVQDTICNHATITFNISTTTSPLGSMLYNLNTIPSDSISGYTLSGSDFAISNFSNTLINTSFNLKNVKYIFSPIINYNSVSLICNGSDTSVIIYVNPTPRLRIGLTKGLSSSLDTICYNQGTKLNITTPNTKVIGKVKYTMNAIYTPDSITGIVAPPGHYPSGSLPQSLPQNLINTSHSIQTVTFTLTPVIDSVKGSSCGNGIPVTINLSIVPNITYSLKSKKYLGGWNISCYGLSDGDIQIINLAGGLASKPYNYLWNTGIKIDSIYNLKAGKDSVTVTDHLGCYATKETVLTQPNPLNPKFKTQGINCTLSHKGSITLQNPDSIGGTPPYSFLWKGAGLHFDSASIIVPYPADYYLTLTDTNNCIKKDTEKINPIGMIPNFSPSLYTAYTNDSSNISCYGKSDGSFFVTLETDQIKTITCNGSNGFIANSQFITGLKAGKYSFTIVDISGCILDTSYTLLQPDTIHFHARPFVYPGGYNIECTGNANGRITIDTVTGGHKLHQYIWWSSDKGTGLLNGTHDSVQNSLSAGTYYVYVKDSFSYLINGYVKDSFCTSYDTAVIKLHQPPPLVVADSVLTLSNGENIACNGDNTGEIFLSSSGGYPDYTYRWTASGGGSGIVQGDSVQKNLTAGSYQVTVYYGDTVCPTGPYLFTLYESSPLRITTNPDSLYYTPILRCYNDSDGQIDVDVTGGVRPGNGYYFKWSTFDGSTLNPSDQHGITNLKIGHYTVKVTDEYNCTVDSTFIITQPDSLTLSDSSTNVSCLAGVDDGRITATVTGGTRPYTYDWYQNGVLMPDDKDSSLSAIAASSYKVIVSDRYRCGPDTSTSIITARKSLNIETDPSNYNGVNVSCYGSSDGIINITNILGGTKPYSYKWFYYKDTTNVIDTMAYLYKAIADTYFIKVNDRNGCKGDTFIALGQPKQIMLSFSSNNLLCAGESTGSIIVNAKGGIQPYNYGWSNQDKTDENLNLKAGWYILTLTDANSCTATDSAEITQPPPIVVKNDSSITHEPFCTDSQDGEIGIEASGGVGGITYYWLNVQGNPQTNTIFNMGIGTYVCKIQDANSCIHLDTVKLNPKYSACLNIPNVFAPNGAHNLWKITAGDPLAPISVQDMYPNAIVEVYSRWGTLLFRSEPGYPNPWNGTYNGNPLPIDSYYYVITPKHGEGTICGNVTIIK